MVDDFQTTSRGACNRGSAHGPVLAQRAPGGVFGNLNGIAPGCALTLTYKPAESREQLLLHLGRLRTHRCPGWKWGVVSQRTRVYHTGLDVQRGVLVGFT